jgi:hypothetical protein
MSLAPALGFDAQSNGLPPKIKKLEAEASPTRTAFQCGRGFSLDAFKAKKTALLLRGAPFFMQTCQLPDLILFHSRVRKSGNKFEHGRFFGV